MKKYLFLYFVPVIINIITSIIGTYQLDTDWRLLSVCISLFLNVIILPLLMMGLTHMLIIGGNLYISMFLCFVSVTFSPLIYILAGMIVYNYEYILRYYIHDIVASTIIFYQVIIPGVISLFFCLIETLLIIKRKIRR